MLNAEYRFLLAASAAVSLTASCGGGGGGTGGSHGGDEAGRAGTAHPWDWVPADPVLAGGRVVYLDEGALCHDEGEEGAPRLTKKDEWLTRMTKGEGTLVNHAIEGFIGEDGEMPARGGSKHLSDDEVVNAVRYMIATPK